MKNKLIYLICALITLSSCEKAVTSDALTDEEDGISETSTGSARLTVITRTGGGSDEDAVAQGLIYIFNTSGHCVSAIMTDENSNSATAHLDAGTYTVVAIGGDDLTRFQYPNQSEASLNSVITLKDGKVMDDLLYKQATVSLTDGESLNLNMSLEHKVLCLSELEVLQVPTDITSVEVEITPFYHSMTLSGTYPATPVTSYRVSLVKQSDGTTWQSTPSQMLFPSVGTPTIKIIFSKSTTSQSYSYTCAEAMPANHHFSISGTFNDVQGVSLTGILTAAEWGEDRNITFEFDNENQIVTPPVAGQSYLGYYCVSVDATAHTAVLLANEDVAIADPSDPSSATEWLAQITPLLASLTKPAGVTNDWRLPTLDEFNVFSSDGQLAFNSSGYTKSFFCDNSGTLNWACMQRLTDESYHLLNGASLQAGIHLRPVIDITF